MACPHQAKANAKAKIFFYVCRLFFYLFRLFFDLFRFRIPFCLVWTGLKCYTNYITANLNHCYCRICESTGENLDHRGQFLQLHIESALQECRWKIYSRHSSTMKWENSLITSMTVIFATLLVGSEIPYWKLSVTPMGWNFSKIMPFEVIDEKHYFCEIPMPRGV